MTELAPPPETSQQALRLKRFLGASTTYALGLAILGLCSALGLLSVERLALVAGAFLAINVALWAVFRSGWNLRAADPSLTLLQVGIATSMVALILIIGERIHFIAVPFYSSLFVFAMLRLKPRELFGAELYVLATYCAAIAIRMRLYGDRLDLRIEGIHAVLVVAGSVWFALAASYISALRARLRESKQAIERLASRDALTGTWNRGHIDALLAGELQRKARGAADFCLCLVDVDHFKSINDRYGHLAGDAVLRDVARAMQAELRSIDQLGRFGGEEFLIVLPATTLDAARACADRLLRAVAGVAVCGASPDRVTISIGIAQCTAEETSDSLLSRADAALYRAKHEGRNRIAVGTSKEPAPARNGPRQPALPAELCATCAMVVGGAGFEPATPSV